MLNNDGNSGANGGGRATSCILVVCTTYQTARLFRKCFVHAKISRRLDMQRLMKEAQDSSGNKEGRKELANTDVEGTAGGGMVKATVARGLEVRAIGQPEVVDPDDIEMLRI